MFGIELRGFFPLRYSIGILAKLGEILAEQIVRIGILRIENNHLPQELGRARGVVQLLLGDSEQVEGSRIPRIQSHGSFEVVFRFVIAAEIE